MMDPFFDSLDKIVHLDDPKVLLVEDDPITRWLVRTVLKDQCMLLTAKDSDDALMTYHAYQPDMVLLDIGLPSMDGKELLSCMMQLDPSAYIVMLSGQNTPENIAETIENGAKGFIAKPFSKKDILEHLSTCPIRY